MTSTWVSSLSSDRFHHLAAGALPGMPRSLAAVGYDGKAYVLWFTAAEGIP